MSDSPVEKKSAQNESLITSIEDCLFIVPENCQNKHHYKKIKRQCQIIDNIVNLIKESSVVISDASFDDEIFFQLLDGYSRNHTYHFATMSLPFTIKLENCKVARTYMRVSGYLDEMCEYVTKLYGKITNNSEGNENEEVRKYMSEIIVYLVIIEKSVIKEVRSKLKIVEVRKIVMKYMDQNHSFLLLSY